MNATPTSRTAVPLGRVAGAAALALLLAGQTQVSAQPADSAIQIAGIDHGSLMVRDGVAAPARMVHGGGPGRALPAWSPDGERIAFVQATDRQVGLADLVVVSATGVELSRVTIEPAGSGVAYAGMRAIEALRWVADDRIAVRGSINPSQSQYYVFDVTTRRAVADFIDDRSAAAFSPDGVHVVAHTGGPHFAHAQQRAMRLELDGQTLATGASGEHADILAAPRWSNDGRAFAWVVDHRATGRVTLAVWRSGEIHEWPLLLSAGQSAELRWSGARIVITVLDGDRTRPTGQAWVVDPRDGSTVTTTAAAAPPDPLAPARTLRDRLLAQARAQGLREADAWCRSCGLEALVRGTE